MQIDTIAFSLVNSIPSILAWLIGIVLAAVMLRRGGAGPEKLLLTGCGLMLFTTVAAPVARTIMALWITREHISFTSLGWLMSSVSIVASVISLGALLCIVVAFWKRVVKSREEAA